MDKFNNPFLQETYERLAGDPEGMRLLKFRNLKEVREVLGTVEKLTEQMEDMPEPMIQIISLVAGAMLKKQKLEGKTLEELVRLHGDIAWAAESAWGAMAPELGYLMDEKKDTFN